MSDAPLQQNRDTQRVPHRDINAAQRAAMALELRTQKMKYDDIARACGYSDRSAAHKAVQREMDRTIVTNVEELRREELNFLDMLTTKCLEKMKDKANKDPLWAVDRLLKISEQRARLMGLDVSKDANIAANMVVVREVPNNYLEGPKSE